MAQRLQEMPRAIETDGKGGALGLDACRALEGRDRDRWRDSDRCRVDGRRICYDERYHQ